MAATIRRPIGLTIATIWAGLFAGLFPVCLAASYFVGPARESGMYSDIQIMFTVCLGLGVIMAAIGTWRGVSNARYLLTALVLIYYGLVAYTNYWLANSDIDIRGGTEIAMARCVRSVITAFVISGYLLLSHKARAYSQGRSIIAAD